ncbi:hypothetical protein D3C71_77400 [compost metagenome]
MRIQKDPLLHALNTIQTRIEQCLTIREDSRVMGTDLVHGAPHETSLYYTVRSNDGQRTTQCRLTFTHEDVSSYGRVPVVWFDSFDSPGFFERLQTGAFVADVESMQPQLEALAQRALDVLTKP